MSQLKLPFLFEVVGVSELSRLSQVDSGVLELLRQATPTLWGELHGPETPIFPGSMPKSRQSWDGALSPAAIPCVGGAITS
jgi:hypothetical protein